MSGKELNGQVTLNGATLTNTMDLRAPGPLNLVALLATRRVQEAVAGIGEVVRRARRGHRRR
ncbi:hypothetical protein [Agromyces bauzanensis]|uniref:Uncharacterized protein n=1 Tax=Agromyces bauzanensis TaxID=1308924 RepID=A0A917UW48_9MICO|nr:hypothetical protein [Agromyces bauzanensis]GGJ89043.1 hypothetical protein GCM10011372_29540 [Agromyces bauzanensis]